VAISDNLDSFAGRPVIDWEVGAVLGDGATTAYRLRLDYDKGNAGLEWGDLLADFLKDPRSLQTQAMVVGDWGVSTSSDNSSAEAIAALANAHHKLPNLKYLFFGDITYEECEISWLVQGDFSPLLSAYPELEYLAIRGGQELSLGKARHAKLNTLIIQAGGLSPDVIHQIAAADFPLLEHLELWLGESNYGGDTTVEDIVPLLKDERFAKLKYLGLKNSEIEDQIAAAVAQAPIVGRLETLDLSMGTLSDEGARALLASPWVKKLKRLDVHHHYLSDGMQKQLHALGIDVDSSDPQGEADADNRYVAVGE